MVLDGQGAEVNVGHWRGLSDHEGSIGGLIHGEPGAHVPGEAFASRRDSSELDEAGTARVINADESSGTNVRGRSKEKNKGLTRARNALERTRQIDPSIYSLRGWIDRDDAGRDWGAPFENH